MKTVRTTKRVEDNDESLPVNSVSELGSISRFLIVASACCMLASAEAGDDSGRFLSSLESWEEALKQTREEGGRWFRSEYDLDNRGYNVLHFMGHSPLPLGMNLWGFIDIEGADMAGANREDLGRYFLELDLKKKLWNNAGVLAEVNDLQGEDNAIGRFGVFWKPNTDWLSPDEGLLAGKFDFAIKYFPLETDYQGGQFSFNWNKTFDSVADGRISAGGFFDLNYDVGASGSNVVVTEHQIRLRVLEGLFLITEFRVNEFLRDDFGIAPGIQYRF